MTPAKDIVAWAERQMEPVEPQDPGSNWQIENVPDLDWALQRVVEISREKEQLVAAHEAYKRRVETLIDKAQRGVAYFEAQIAAYCEKAKPLLLGSGARKSRTFPYGTVGWRHKNSRLVVKDKDALNEWLMKQSDVSLYRVKVEPEMKALQEHFRTQGVIPPGMEVQEEGESFYIAPVDPFAMTKVEP